MEPHQRNVASASPSRRTTGRGRGRGHNPGSPTIGDFSQVKDRMCQAVTTREGNTVAVGSGQMKDGNRPVEICKEETRTASCRDLQRGRGRSRKRPDQMLYVPRAVRVKGDKSMLNNSQIPPADNAGNISHAKEQFADIESESAEKTDVNHASNFANNSEYCHQNTTSIPTCNETVACDSKSVDECSSSTYNARNEQRDNMDPTGCICKTSLSVAIQPSTELINMKTQNSLDSCEQIAKGKTKRSDGDFPLEIVGELVQSPVCYRCTEAAVSNPNEPSGCTCRCRVKNTSQEDSASAEQRTVNNTVENDSDCGSSVVMACDILISSNKNEEQTVKVATAVDRVCFSIDASHPESYITDKDLYSASEHSCSMSDTSNTNFDNGQEKDDIIASQTACFTSGIQQTKNTVLNKDSLDVAKSDRNTSSAIVADQKADTYRDSEEETVNTNADCPADDDVIEHHDDDSVCFVGVTDQVSSVLSDSKQQCDCRTSDIKLLLNSSVTDSPCNTVRNRVNVPMNQAGHLADDGSGFANDFQHSRNVLISEAPCETETSGSEGICSSSVMACTDNSFETAKPCSDSTNGSKTEDNYCEVEVNCNKLLSCYGVPDSETTSSSTKSDKMESNPKNENELGCSIQEGKKHKKKSEMDLRESKEVKMKSRNKKKEKEKEKEKRKKSKSSQFEKCGDPADVLDKTSISQQEEEKKKKKKKKTASKLTKEGVESSEKWKGNSNSEKRSAGDGSDDDWDALFDDDGECCNPEMLGELSQATGIGDPCVKNPRFDYLSFTPKDIQLDDPGYSHIVEIYGFSEELKTQDLMQALSAFREKGFDIKWVDDTHALGVFTSEIAANQAIKMCSGPLLKLRKVSEGSAESKSKARRCCEFLQPYKERPQTTKLTAYRMVTGALGVKSHMTREERSKEREKLKEAREQKRLKEKQRAEAWGD